MADAEDGGHFRSRGGQDGGQRRTAVGGERIAFVGAGLGLVMDHGVLGQDGEEAFDDPRLAGEDQRIGDRHVHERDS